MDVHERHAAVVHIAKYFNGAHLHSEQLQLVSGRCAELAQDMIDILPDNPELTAGLRKLLEAKDCFVRAAL